MELKFLKEGTTTKEEGEVKIEFCQISSSIQSLLISMGATKTPAGKTALSTYILKNIIANIKINGVSYLPFDVAERSDLSDPDTVKIFFQISRMVMSEIILDLETKKKSGEQELLKGKENPVKNAPEVSEESPQKLV